MNKKPKNAQEHNIEVMRLQSAVRLSTFRPKVEKNKKAYDRTQRKRDDKELKEDT